MTVTSAIERKAPPLGGFNLTFLGLEVRRMLRNRRTVIFTVIMPLIFFFLVGRPQKGNLVPGTSVNGMEYAMISFALYGAMSACTSGGSMVAVERALGWSRQLRLTPLRPVAYVLTKVAVAMVLGLVPVLACFAAGLVSGVKLPVHVWILSGLAAWLGSLVFAALGLCFGYLMPSENVMQILAPILAILALFGGIFFPLEAAPHIIQAIAKWSPVYGVGEISRAPLTHHFQWISVLNVVAWTVVFAAGSALLFRRDTKRV